MADQRRAIAIPAIFVPLVLWWVRHQLWPVVGYAYWLQGNLVIWTKRGMYRLEMRDGK